MKITRIARPLVVVSVLAVAAVGCGGSGEDSLEQLIEEQSGGSVDVDLGDDGIVIESKDGNMTIDEDGSFTVVGEDGEVVTGEGDGDGNMTIEGEDGSFSLNQGSEIPDEWPAEVPQPEGIELTSSSVVDAPDGAAVTVTGNVDDPADFVAAYGSTLESAGFTKDSEYSAEGTVSALFSSEGYQVSVATSTTDGENFANIAVFPQT